MSPLAIHEFCALFPALDDGGLAALAADIKSNGLREPITLFGGAIVDGRNRWRACEIAGIEPRYVDYSGRPEDLLLWVASVNLHRRHLSPSQQALIGAEIARRLKAGTGRSATAAVATQLAMSLRQVQYAGKVLERGTPELVAAVRDDRVSVQIADKIATLPPRRQRKLVEQGPIALFGEYRRLGGRIWREHEAAAAPLSRPRAARQPEREWDRLFTSFGVPLRGCTLDQIEAELARLPQLRRLLAALRDQVDAGGTVESSLSASEFAHLWKAARS